MSESSITSLKILSWNIEGLNTNNGECKMNMPGVLKTVNKFDVICIQETFETEQSNLHVNGFTCFSSHRSYRHKRAKRGSGGVIMLVRNQFVKGVSKQKSVSDDILWLKFKKDFFGLESDLYISSCYMLPENSSILTWRDLGVCDALEIDITKYSSLGNILICGDLNARTGLLQDFVENDDRDHIPLPHAYTPDYFNQYRCNLDKTVNNYGEWLMSTCISANLCTLNGRSCGDVLGNYTCYRKNSVSTLDYIIASKVLFDHFSYFKVLPFTLLSDHCPISTSFRINCKAQSKSKVETLKNCPLKFKWESNSSNNFQAALDDIRPSINDFVDRNYNQNVENASKDLLEIIITAAKSSLKIVREKPKRKHYSPGYDKDCWMIRKNLLYVKELMERYPRNREIRECFYDIRKIYRKTIKEQKSKFKEELLKKLAAFKEKDPQKYWKLLESLKLFCGTKSNRGENPIPADEWLEHFKTLFTDTNNQSKFINMEQQIQSKINSNIDLDYEFTKKEIFDAINQLKNNKSPGPDSITNEMLKSAKFFLVPAIIKLFNLVLTQQIIPAEWKVSIVTPIYKADDPNNPGNYRGIAVNSCLGKLFSLVMNKRLSNKIEGKNLFTEYQSGFRSDYRTTDNIYIMTTLIRAYRAQKKKIFACFIDLKKAFDTVSRPALFFKLANLGIGGKFFNTVKNMYTNDKIAVKIRNKMTNDINCSMGVRQGDGLSPTLFNIYVNDIPQLFSDPTCDPPKIGNEPISALLYADDLVIFSETETGLKTCLKKFNGYCRMWHLKINVAKSKIMIFNSKNNNYGPFSVDNENLEIVTNYKYLGMMISRSTSFDLGINSLCKKSIKATYLMNKTLWNADFIPVDIYLKSFDTLIKPILTYGCEVWGLDLTHNCTAFKDNFVDDKSKPEMLHVSFLKKLLGVNSKSSNLATRSEFGRLPLIVYIAEQIMKYNVRIKAFPDTRLLKRVYSASSGEIFSLQKTCNHLSTISNFSITNYRLDSKKDAKHFIKDFKSHWKFYLENEWYDKLNSKVGSTGQGNKLRFYSKFKKCLKLEKYLLAVKNPTNRSNMAKLRISAHKLEIEVGRHKRKTIYENGIAKRVHIPVNERVCLNCNLMCIEDETHFLFRCPSYQKEREEMLNPLCNLSSHSLSNNDNDRILDQIFSEDNHKNLEIFAGYITTLFTIRQNRNQN